MSNKAILIKNSSINLFSYLYIIVIAIFYIPLLIKNLGTEQFGLYIIFAGIPQLISSLDLGLTASTIKHLVNKDKKVRQGYWNSSFRLFTILGAVLSLVSIMILLLLKNYKSFASIPYTEYSKIIIFLGIAILLDYLIMHAITLSQSQQRFEIYNIRTFIVGSNGLVAALVSIFSSSLSLIFFVRLLTRLLTYLLLIFDSKKFISLPKFSFKDKNYSRTLLNFGLKNFIGKAVNQIQAQFPKFALLNFISSSAVAIYSIPLTLIQRATGVISQVSLAFFPFTANLEKKKINKLKKVYISTQLLIAILGIFGIFVVKYFARSVLLWWLSDIELVDAIFPILTVLSYALAVNMLAPLPSALFDGLGKPQLTSFFATVTAVLEITLTLLLISRFKILAPAYGSLIALSLTTPLLILKSITVLNDERVG